MSVSNNNQELNQAKRSKYKSNLEDLVRIENQHNKDECYSNVMGSKSNNLNFIKFLTTTGEKYVCEFCASKCQSKKFEKNDIISKPDALHCACAENEHNKIEEYKPEKANCEYCKKFRLFEKKKFVVKDKNSNINNKNLRSNNNSEQESIKCMYCILIEISEKDLNDNNDNGYDLDEYLKNNNYIILNQENLECKCNEDHHSINE